MNRLGIGLVAAVAALMVLSGTVAVGAKTHHKAHHPTTLTVKRAGKAFLADVAPLNAKITVFGAAATAWTSNTTDAQAEAAAAPVIAALTKFNSKMETTKWPSAAKQDVHSLVLAVSPLEAGLQNLATLNFLDVETWLQSFTTATDGVATADGLVRSDLHLPPAS